MASNKNSNKECTINSQENHCRKFAKSKGYDLVNVFHDKEFSGNKKDRSGMNALLEFLNEQQNKTIVIIEDVARLARDVSVHFQLRNEIIKAGGKLESPTIEFGEDPQSKFLEKMLAIFSEYQRKKINNC